MIFTSGFQNCVPRHCSSQQKCALMVAYKGRGLLDCSPPTGSRETVARLPLPQNVACGFAALRSSASDSQHRKSLQRRVRESQLLKLNPGISGDGVHPRLGDKECGRRDRRRARSVHLSPKINACASDAELEEFSMDPRRSPQRIGNARLADKLAYLQRNRWPATPRFRFPSPI